MDQEVVLFLETAGPTVVAAMATDAYQRTKDAVVAVWRRLIPFGAEAVETQLEQTRSQVVAAREQGDTDTEQDLGRRWQANLQPLFSADPGAAAELRQALLDAGATVPVVAIGEQNRIGSIRLDAKAEGHGRVYQAGHDQHITEQSPQHTDRP